MYRLNPFRPVAVVVAALVVLAFAGSASAQDPVPFRGWANVTVIGADFIPPNSQKLTGFATGVSTHLGQFTRTETLVLDLSTFTFTGKVIFTAANGDQLYADMVGGFTSPKTASGTYTFTGGTGRFRNASGNAAFSVNAVSGGFAVTFNGTIQY